jgi:hypothetical protein
MLAGSPWTWKKQQLAAVLHHSTQVCILYAVDVRVQHGVNMNGGSWTSMIAGAVAVAVAVAAEDARSAQQHTQPPHSAQSTT